MEEKELKIIEEQLDYLKSIHKELRELKFIMNKILERF